MFNKKQVKTIAAVIAIILVAAMILPIILVHFIG